MSSEDFFGRPITPATADLEFDICEVCQRKSAQWLEIQYQDNLPVVRFSCRDCHSDYMVQRKDQDPNLIRQISDDEEIEEAARPGWVDEFIKDQNASNSIEVIGNTDETKEESSTFTEAPASFYESDETTELPDREQRQIAAWAPKFIQEALFGPNPEGWLEQNGGYTSDALDITVTTLGSFVNHDVPSVKLSAIQCLQGLYRRDNQYKDVVLREIEKYLSDQDETVADFAKQTITQIN